MFAYKNLMRNIIDYLDVGKNVQPEDVNKIFELERQFSLVNI